MKSILVADPEPFIRDVLRIRLAGAGYRILLAADGPSLLASAEGVDLLIMDVCLPAERDGFETCQRLKNGRATAGIPVVLLSREAQRPEIAFQYSTWAVARFPKPFVPREVVRAVQRLLAPPPAAEET